MMTRTLILAAVVATLTACNCGMPAESDAGTGGGVASTGGGAASTGGGTALTGGGSAAGGGTASTGGGSSSTGGGTASTGGGSATGGGTAASGGGSTSGGGTASTGGGSASGGGTAATGGGSASGGGTASTDGGSAVDAGVACDFADAGCASGEYCDAPNCTRGTCRPKLPAAQQLITRDPVCGCDGITYWNSSVANSLGMAISDAGVCVGARGCGARGGITCPSYAICNREYQEQSWCSFADLSGLCWAMPSNCPTSVSAPYAANCSGTCANQCAIASLGEAWYPVDAGCFP